MEFWVNEKAYFGGDFYVYRNAPLVLHLKPGEHRIDLRLIRDVRAMGGLGCPKLAIRLEAQLSNGGLTVEEQGLVAPDMVNNRLASDLASVTVRNGTEDWICVLGIESVEVSMAL